ncbi:hypothetical protein niasHT_032516 [Heterodera trifolii]|uniref:Effector protein n=1 Tax=Heterodera trifolii TaxID=157864 RepID=A0ABD2IY68_9BILA
MNGNDRCFFIFHCVVVWATTNCGGALNGTKMGPISFVPELKSDHFFGIRLLSGFLPLSSDSGNSSSSSSDEGTSSSASSSAANCALFECPAGANSECALTDATDAADQEGLLSVRLRRKDTQPPPTLSSTSNNNNTSSAEQQDDEEDDGQSAENGGDQRHILSLGNDGTSTEDGTGGGTTAEQKHQQQHQLSAEETPSTLARTPTTTTARKRTKSLLNFGTWDERFPLRAEITPVWAIGLAIVITVVKKRVGGCKMPN